MELSDLEQVILDIRMKLYSVQCTLGFNSQKACYIEIIANECIKSLRQSSSLEVREHCRKKIDQAFKSIGYCEYI